LRNHVSAEARATYDAGVGASKDQLEEFVAHESLGLLDHYRIIRGALYKGLSAAAELGDSNSLALLAGRGRILLVPIYRSKILHRVG
jgi:hypothetical protein